MPALGIIDDRKDARQTLSRSFSALLARRLSVVAQQPFDSLPEYLYWIRTNEVSVLVVDERLNEEKGDSGSHAQYAGHELVAFLRKHIPDFPIYVLTSWADDEGLVADQWSVEGIISRREFVGATQKAYVERMVRAGQRFHQSFQSDLATFGILAQKIATGQATETEKEQAKALQTSLGLAFAPEIVGERSKWLEDVNLKLNDLNRLADELQVFLQKRDS